MPRAAEIGQSFPTILLSSLAPAAIAGGTPLERAPSRGRAIVASTPIRAEAASTLSVRPGAHMSASLLMGEWTPSALARALSGDDRTLLRLIQDLTPHVQREVAVLLFRRAAAGRDPRQELEDMTQEVLTQLLASEGAKILTWEPERGLSFESFIKMVARQQASMVLRSERRSPWSDLPTRDDELELALPPTPGRAAEEAEAKAVLAHLTSMLRDDFDERGQTLFELLYVQETDVDEVCRSMSMSRDAVYAWRRRFRRWAAEFRAELDGSEGSV